MISSTLRITVLAASLIALAGGPALAQEADPTDDVDAAGIGTVLDSDGGDADDVASAADGETEDADASGASADDDVEDYGDDCGPQATGAEDAGDAADALAAEPTGVTEDEDDPACSNADANAEADAKKAAKPLSLSIPTLLRLGYATVGPARPSAAGVVVQELLVPAKARRAAPRPVARVRRKVGHGGRVTLHVAVTPAGRKLLKGTRASLKATLRTTIVLRGGRSSTVRRTVLLVPARRR